MQKQVQYNPFADDDDDEDDGIEAGGYADRTPTAPQSISKNYSLVQGKQSNRLEQSARRMSADRQAFSNVMKKSQKKMKQSGEGSSIVCYSDNDENRIVRFLVSERVYGYPGTDGSWFSNYKNYVWNNHPFFSLCCANRFHPYSLRNRCVVFLCITLFAITISFVFWNTNYVPQLSICREGCGSANSTMDNSTLSNSTISLSQLSGRFYETTVIKDTDSIRLAMLNVSNSTSADYCIGGYNNGLAQDEWESRCKYYRSWMLNAAIGAILVPYGSFLKFISTCGCLKGRDFFKHNCIGVWCSNTVDYIGAQTLSIALALNIILVAWAIYEAHEQHLGYEIFKSFIISKLWSLVEWFVWATPYFSYKYPLDRRYFYSRLPDAGLIESAGINLNPISSSSH